MKSLEELIELVKDKESFIQFVEAMAEEREESEKLERDNPEKYLLDGANGWKNGDISGYLWASLGYFEKGPYHKPEIEPSWRMVAEFLYFGKIIE